MHGSLNKTKDTESVKTMKKGVKKGYQKGVKNDPFFDHFLTPFYHFLTIIYSIFKPNYRLLTRITGI